MRARFDMRMPHDAEPTTAAGALQDLTNVLRTGLPTAARTAGLDPPSRHSSSSSTSPRRRSCCWGVLVSRGT